MNLEVQYEPSEQVFCTIIGSLIAGYSIAWSSPISRILSSPDYYPPFLVICRDQMHWIFLWVPIGATIGALLAGSLADLIGRLGTYTYLFFTLGVLLVHILGIFNSYFTLGFVITILAVIFLFSQLFIPESPTYLVKNNRKEEAMNSLKRLRNPHDNIEMEMEELQIHLQNVISVEATNFGKIFTKVNMKSVLIVVVLMIFHQICGFNATFILSNTGKKAESLCIFIAACLQSLVTLFASHLVDKVGRKVLLEISSVITSISLLSLGFYFWSRPWSMEDSYYLRWVLLISLMTYFAAFSIGLGPVPWLILPEILTPQIKALGIGIAVGTNWLCFSLLSFLYQSLQAISDLSFIFWAMATVSFIAFIFTAFILIETKGKSLQEIQDKLIGLQLNRVDVAK
ncbi:hypothetical protein V9T40_005304 [Parthenolecanium corni]|uniref:Major facilitator superfamily (MFS) profile domain-containing protein n=1 Tax=Parthenolecanium corni TaxID=536013 RepID=A0AAN9Y2I1_9HEMI